MLDKLFPYIADEDTDPVMDFAQMLFFSALLSCLASVVLFLVCVYVL